MQKKYDLVAIDDAFVDEFYSCSPEHVTAQGIQLGDTVIRNRAQADAIVAGLKQELEMSGGGSANAAVRMRENGAKTAFCGLIGTGRAADLFRRDLAAAKVDLHEIPTESPDATGRCICLVNPDAQRTMITSLPLTTSIVPEQIPADILKDTKIVFTQAYRWSDATRDAFLHAFKTTREAGGKAAFCLSASWAVQRSREDFLGLLDGKIDILFGNEDEFAALYPDKSPEEIQKILQAISASGKCETIAYTLSEKGSIIFHKGEAHVIAPFPAQKVDTTGAGDAYAAGVIHGINTGLSIDEAGALGSKWGAEVIQHYGARQLPKAPLLTIHKTDLVTAKIPFVQVLPNTTGWVAGQG